MHSNILKFFERYRLQHKTLYKMFAKALFMYCMHSFKLYGFYLQLSITRCSLGSQLSNCYCTENKQKLPFACFYSRLEIVQRLIYFSMVLVFIFVIYINRTLSGQICCLKRSNVILRSQINGFPPSQYLTHALSPASQFDTHRTIKLYFVLIGIFYFHRICQNSLLLKF